MKLAGIWHSEDLRNWNVQTERNGRWYLARPIRAFLSMHLKAVWLVLTGRADALIWGGKQ